MFLMQNLRMHLLAQHPSFHKWHHFTYNAPLIRPSLGTKEHLVPHITLIVRLDFLKKILSIEQLFFYFCKLFMSIAHFPPTEAYYCLLF